MDKQTTELLNEVRGMRAQVSHAEGVLTAAIGKVNRRDAAVGWATVLFSVATAALATFKDAAPPWVTAAVAAVTAIMAAATKYQADQRDKGLPRLTSALSGFSAVGTDAANRLDMWNLEISRKKFDLEKALAEKADLRTRLAALVNGNADLSLPLKAGAAAAVGSGTGLVTVTPDAEVSQEGRTYIWIPDEEDDADVYTEAPKTKAAKPAPISIRRIS